VSVVNDWLALLRVHEGGVTTLAGRFFNHGRPVADYLVETFTGLISTGQLALGRATPSGQQQVCVTRAGQIRYTELSSNGARKIRDGDR
jgi:hypothetical protein